jgi:hypothetical protein
VSLEREHEERGYALSSILEEIMARPGEPIPADTALAMALLAHLALHGTDCCLCGGRQVVRPRSDVVEVRGIDDVVIVCPRCHAQA